MTIHGDSISMQPVPAWIAVGEVRLSAPPAGDVIRAAVAALLPRGDGATRLAPAIAHKVHAAVVFACTWRRARNIRLQCFLRQAPGMDACGWGFFLIESGAEAPAGTHEPADAVVQIYLFHE